MGRSTFLAMIMAFLNAYGYYIQSMILRSDGLGNCSGPLVEISRVLENKRTTERFEPTLGTLVFDGLLFGL
jgi:hypothetical protein